MNNLYQLKSAYPDVDIEKGLAYCANSEEFYIELLKDFAEPVKIQEIQAAYEKNDWRIYTIKVHALKGNARTLGFTRLALAAEELQNAGEREDANFIKENHEKMISILNEVVECINKFC